MSEQQVQLICTDRGDHRPVVLLNQRPDDPVDVFLHEPIIPPTNPPPWISAQLLDEVTSTPNGLRCRQCGRNPRLRARAVRALLIAAAERPEGRLDLSMLRL